MKEIQRKSIALLLLFALLFALLPVQAIVERISAASKTVFAVEFTHGGQQYILEGYGYAKLNDILECIGITGEPASWQISNSELFDVVLGSEDGPQFRSGDESESESEPTSEPAPESESDGASPIQNENLSRTVTDGRDTEENESGSAVATEENASGSAVAWVVSYQPFTSVESLYVTMDDGAAYRIVVTDAIFGDGEKDIPGVSQGKGLTDFAPLIPLADIWVDASKFKAASSYVNGTWTEFIPGELMTAANSPFKEDKPANEGQSKASNYYGKHFVYYDSTVEGKALNGYIATTRTSDGETVYQSYNYFPGVVGTYKWADAASRLKEDGTEESFDVYIEYSNPMISLQATKTGDSEDSFIVTDPNDVNSWNDAYVGLFGGNAVTTGAKNSAGSGFDERYALQIDAKPYVKDKAGNIVNARIYFPMIDLDVNRSGGGGFSGFYRGNSLLDNYDAALRRYSEGARVKDGLVINSYGDRIYIPGSDGGYLSTIDYDNGEYRITGLTGDPDPGTFYSGFLSLIQNNEFKVSVTQAAGVNGLSVITYIMAGSEYNYRLRHSTETLRADGTPEADGTIGGTIQTTREGNHNGELNDGQIIEPSMIATAVGQTIVYTFTPKPGYALKSVYVWHDPDKTDPDFPTIPGMHNTTEISEGNGVDKTTYQAHDDDGDGIIDRYTYEFRGINSDNAIHVVWVKTALEIRKSITGSGAEQDTFDFTIKAWGDSDNDGIVEFVNFADAASMGALASRFTDAGNGLYSFTLDSSETINIPDGVIPFGFQYEICEIQQSGKYGTLDGWEPVGSTVRAGTLTTENPFAKANFTNKREKPIDPKNTLTVKKVWDNDVASIRPKYIDIYAQNTLIPSGVQGGNTNPAAWRIPMQNLFGGQDAMRSNLTAFKYGTKAQAEDAALTRIELPLDSRYGQTPVYMWREGTELFIYSDADIYLIGSLESLFLKCGKLTDISALAHLHTDFVTSTFQMFQECTALDSADLEAVSGWNTAGITKMKRMFSSCKSIEDLSHISGWDVSSVTDMAEMFKGTGAAKVQQTLVAQKWQPVRVTTWDNMFQNANGGNALNSTLVANLPVFEARRGTWNTYGTYTPQDAALNTKPPTPDPNAVFSPKPPISTRAYDVDENGAWVFKFEVPEKSTWKVWEVLPVGYAPYYTLTSAVYYANSTDEQNHNVGNDFGPDVGKIDAPVTGAKPESVTVLTNTRKEQTLTVRKASSPATNEKFTFTLKLWSISESNYYDIPSNQLDESIKRIAPGTYEFKLTPQSEKVITLPAGIRYNVVEAPVSGWTLQEERNTHGLLDADKEASFLNVKNDILKVEKIWENDYQDGVMHVRPTAPEALGIRVITFDRTSRWKKTGAGILTDIVGTQEQQDAYFYFKNLYDASSLVPELMELDGTTVSQTTAPKKIVVNRTDLTLFQPGDYVVDAVAGNSGQLTVYPVENVPFEHIYTSWDYFAKDDVNGIWLYEFNIPKTDDILSVEEMTVPPYYQKVEKEVVYVNGEPVYRIINSLDVRDLEIKKTTVNNIPGTFQFRISFFYFETAGSTVRKPYTLSSAQNPNGATAVTGKAGTYTFDLQNDNSIAFRGLPLGVSYEIEELTQDGWSLIETTNATGAMDDKNDNSGKISEILIYNGAEYSSRTDAEAAALAAVVEVTPSPSGGNTIYVNTATYSNRDAAIAASIIKNADQTWSYNGVNDYPNYGAASDAAILDAESGNNGDNTFTYNGNTYYTLKSVYKIAYADITDNGDGTFTFGGNTYATYDTAKADAEAAVTVNGSGADEAYEYNGVSYPSHDAAQIIAQNDISYNSDDDTYTFGGVPYNTIEEALAAAMAAIVDNDDATYTYDGVTYPNHVDALAAALAKISANNDNTYTVNRQKYATYAEAEAAAAALITTNTSPDGETYTVRVEYDHLYDAQKAAKLAITKKPYEPRQALFKNSPTYDLSIAKVVSGNMGNKEKDWRFDVTIPSLAGKTVTAQKTSPGSSEDVSLTFDGSGKATFTIRHGETLIIPDLLHGTKYSLSETNVEGYTASSVVVYEVPGANEGDPPVQKTDDYQDANVPEHTMLSDHRVTYTNHLHTTVPTGIYDSIEPAVSLAAIALSIMSVVVAFNVRKKRKLRDERA